MTVYVIKQGDSIYAISRRFNVSPQKIIDDNELTNPDNLVVGQTIVIVSDMVPHTVTIGQSVYSIARRYGISVDDILKANPQITNPSLIMPGQIIMIPQQGRKLGEIYVNGFAFPNIDMNVLQKTLRHLSFLSIFSYQVRSDGSLISINDTPLIQAARQAGVAPFMVITNIEEGGGFSSDLVNSILTNESVQNNLIENILSTMDSKNYYGLNIDFEYIFPEDREAYNNFVRKVSARLRPLGYSITTSLAPKISANQAGLLYEAHDYPAHGALVDHVIIMTYEWGYTYSEAMAVAPVNKVRQVLNYAVSAIPSQKILMGMPNYGYDWTLPFVRGTAARTLSNTEAVNLALRRRAAIRFDSVAQAPYFNYYDDQRRRHEVWFEDARSIEAKLRLVNQYNLGGVSYWTINRYFPQNWLILESLYDVIKVSL